MSKCEGKYICAHDISTKLVPGIVLKRSVFISLVNWQLHALNNLISVKGKQIVIDEILQIGTLNCFGELPTGLV